MGFIEAVQTGFSKTFTFSDRATRSEFWWFYLFLVILNIISNPIILLITSTMSKELALGSMYAINILLIIAGIAFIALGARRLHDIGRSGWWQLLAFTGIGVFVLLYWYIQPSQADNKYGKNLLATE